jgi:hypothetical protein
MLPRKCDIFLDNYRVRHASIVLKVDILMFEAAPEAFHEDVV